MRLIVGIAITLLSFTTLQAEEHPVRWQNGPIPSGEAIAAELDQPVMDGETLTLVSPEDPEEEARVVTGWEYLHFSSMGLEPQSAYDQVIDTCFKRVVEPLLYLQRARPSQVSFLDGEAFGDLPLTSVVTRHFLGNETIEPGGGTIERQPTKFGFHTRSTGVDLMPVARGDFNADGIEDVLVFCSGQSQGERWYGHSLLTRLSEDGAVERIELPKPSQAFAELVAQK